MPTATLTRPTTTTSPRACWWLTRPEAMLDGRLLGFMGIRVGKVKDFYRVVRDDVDDFCETWFVEKENLNGTFAPAYTVCVPTGGNTGRPSCTCPAGKYQGKCRHGSAMAVLAGHRP